MGRGGAVGERGDEREGGKEGENLYTLEIDSQAVL